MGRGIVSRIVIGDEGGEKMIDTFFPSSPI